MFQVNKRVKNTISAIAVLLFSAVFFALAYTGYQKQNINLGTLVTITTKVEAASTDYTGDRTKPVVFFVKFSNLDQVLGVYRKNRNYEDLGESVRPGDTLTAYFIAGRKPGKINTNLVQLEKNGHIILKKEEYEKKHRSLIYVGLITGVVCIVLAFIQFKQR